MHKLLRCAALGVFLCLLVAGCGIFAPRRPEVWQELPKAKYPIPPYARWLKELKICLDPGHGGQAYLPGYKRGPTGVREAEVNLRVAFYLREFLEEVGAQVVMTREDDSYVGLRERCEIANRHQCDLFISMHHNASSREEANYTSTWYHFSPDYSPASLDLARYLQVGVSDALRLPEYPPTGLYSDQLMYRSGFGVLRNIEMPGALMESSFHSNPEEEKKLRKIEYNKREAYGYFLGLAQYAAAGFPKAELLEPPEGGQTTHKTPLLRLKLHDGLAERGIWGKERLQIFTETVIMRLDGKVVPHELDQETGLLTYQVTEALSNDWHTVQVDLMNAYKNHNLPKKLLFQVAPSPAFASIKAVTDTILADGISYLPLEIQALDADSLLLADGTQMSVITDGGTLESPTIALTGGRGKAYLHSDVAVGQATVQALADSSLAWAVVHFVDADYSILEGKILDALTEKPLFEAQVHIEGEGAQVAEDARFFATKLRTAPLQIWVSRPGYFDFSSQVDLRMGRTSILDVNLYPVDDGILFGQTYILDPQFGGSEFGEKITEELDAADLNLQVCQYLRDYLESAGAQVIMLREKDVYVSPKERILRTNEAEKGWYLRVEHGRAKGKPRVAGYSATADEYAKQLGRAVLEPLAQSLNLENGGMVNTGDYEIVQANKNALSVAFMTIGPGFLEMAASDPILLQREAYALYRGIAQYHGLENSLTDSIILKVSDARLGRPIKSAVATLEGKVSLSSNLQGQISFQGLRPREYRVQLIAEGYEPVGMVVSAGSGQTVQVQLLPKS
jgi:N-acetylmuramoyl-L-alanine amidase